MTTLQLSLLNQGNTTSLPEASPAKIFQSPTPTGEGWKVNAQDCFTNSCGLFASADPVTSYWKTSQRCSQSPTGELWGQFSGSFPKSGTMLNGRLYQRPQWVRRTYAKGCLLLPTPTAQDAKNSTLPPSQLSRDTIPGALLRSGIHGELNPEFYQWLMGYSIGWTKLEDAATPSFPK